MNFHYLDMTWYLWQLQHICLNSVAPLCILVRTEGAAGAVRAHHAAVHPHRPAPVPDENGRPHRGESPPSEGRAGTGLLPPAHPGCLCTLHWRCSKDSNKQTPLAIPNLGNRLKTVYQLFAFANCSELLMCLIFKLTMSGLTH